MSAGLVEQPPAAGPPQARTRRDSSRFYVDPVDPARELVSVTTVLSATSSKPFLVDWSAKLAAEYAVERLEVLRALVEDGDPAAAVDLVKRAAARRRDEASGRGTRLHAVLEALVLDAPLPAFDDDPELAAMADQLVAFVVDYGARFLAAEATVASSRYGYAGTLDAVAELEALDGRVLMLDLKTGKQLDEAVPEQLAAYRYADELWLKPPAVGKVTPPAVDGCAVLHVRPDGYQLVHVDAGDEAFVDFLCALDVWRRQQTRRSRIGRPIRRPGEPVPLGDIPSLGRCRGALEAAGIFDLTALAGWHVDALRKLDGIGPKAVEAILEALLVHKLTPGAAA